MRRIGDLGDWILSRFVPKAVAGACCDEYGKCYYKSCGPGKVRYCCYTCNCGSSCGVCHVV